MNQFTPRNGQVFLLWFLGNAIAQAVYLYFLLRNCRDDGDLSAMRVFYVTLTLSGIYVLPTLGYTIMPGSGRTRKHDRVFIVWGCVTTVFVSLVWLAKSST